MKDVISVDSIIFDIAGTAERLGSRHPRLLEEAKPKLRSLLISKLPEKKPVDTHAGGSVNMQRQEYNFAIDDMKAVLDEMFEVRE